MLRPLALDSSVAVIWPGDPAIDTEKSKLSDMYADSTIRPWRDFVVTKPGELVTQFVVGVIAPSDLNRLEDENGRGRFSSLAWGCFLASLRDLVDGPTLTSTDEMGHVKQLVPKLKRGAIEYVDPAWLERTFIRGLREAGVFVGAMARLWNQLREDEAKN